MEETHMEKIVTGIAKKEEDIRRIYERALSRISERGRITEQGRFYITCLDELFSILETVPFNVAVEYINESGTSSPKKTRASLRAFLKTKTGKQKYTFINQEIKKNEV